MSLIVNGFIKHSSDSTISRYKAWLVVTGYAQIHGIDYDETFAQVAKMATLRDLPTW